MQQNQTHQWQLGVWGKPKTVRRGSPRAKSASAAVKEDAREVIEAVESLDLEFTTHVVGERNVWRVVEALTQQVRRLAKEVAELRAERSPRQVQVLPREQVLERVLEYYDAHPKQDLYPSDVAEALNLSAYDVYEATEQLVAEGRLR